MTVVATEVVPELAPVPADDRAAWRDRLGDLELHERLVRTVPALTTVEVTGGPGDPPPTAPALRVSAWNAERGGAADAGAAILRATGATVHLVTELDVGMARSGNAHTGRELARRLGTGCAFGVEFVELGLGSWTERPLLPEGATNERGLHGAAILSPWPVVDAALLRFDTGGVWFTDARDEARVGGRTAVVGRVPLGDGALVVVALHLESHEGPSERAEQVAALLDAVDAYAGDDPVVIGGDLNTQSGRATDLYRSSVRREIVAAEPTRFTDPTPHEPLFDEAARRGYRWDTANAPGPTQRTRADGYPKEPLMRLDWFLVRGVDATDPTTVPALGSDGAAVSDHDALAVTVRASASG